MGQPVLSIGKERKLTQNTGLGFSCVMASALTSHFQYSQEPFKNVDPWAWLLLGLTLQIYKRETECMVRKTLFLCSRVGYRLE